jgi:hypothetical protein
LRAPPNMADNDIVIDKALFHERLNNLVTKWKADKRSGDQVFQGASSIATLVGKASEPGIYLKPAAFQVRLRRFACDDGQRADETP